MIGNLKKVILGLIFTTALLVPAGGTATAFDLFGDPCRDNPEATVCQDSNNVQSQQDNKIFGPNGIIGTIVNILSIVIGFAAVIVLIIAGIQYMLSTGDPTRVNNAKNTILYAVVGLAIAVVAQTIVIFVINKL